MFILGLGVIILAYAWLLWLCFSPVMQAQEELRRELIRLREANHAWAEDVRQAEKRQAERLGQRRYDGENL